MVSPRKQLVVLGDSFVYGWGDPENGGWCEQLRRNFMNLPNGPIIYSLGVRGDGLEKVASRWNQEWNCRGELRRKVPDAILLAVGLNDSARIGSPDGRPQLSAEAYRFGLYQLISTIKKQADVLVMGIPAVDESLMPFAECLWFSNKSGSIYESQIEETCLDLDVPFLPIHKSMQSEESWSNWIEPDGIHLNSSGHYWIYQKLLRWPPLLDWAELNPTQILTPIT